MSSKRRASKGKRINPHYWVYCEGETEEAYIHFLRSEYRLPIEIVSKIAGSSISSRFIQSFKKGKPIHEKDRDFLVYDADVPEVFDRIKQIRDVTLIASNPAIELWFLLHYKNQVTQINEDECVRQLSNRNHIKYKKGVIDESLQIKLREKCEEACARSKHLPFCMNPSTNMHIFIEALEKARDEK